MFFRKRATAPVHAAATLSPAAIKNHANATASADPQALMLIKDLSLRARAVVEGFMTGLHRSPYHGLSVEFSEYRPYSQGDDPRSLDWKLYARSDRYFVKRFEDETNRRCFLLVDQSLSMSFGSIGYSKAQYAQTLAATIAYFLTQQHDAVGLVTFSDELHQYLPAKIRPRQFRHILAALDQPLRGRITDLAKPIEHVANLVSQRSLIVMISDVLVEVESFRRSLALLTARGHEVWLLRTLDPAEIQLQLAKAGMVRDAETDRLIYVDPELAAKSYQEAFEKHREELKAVCDSLGIEGFDLSTDRPLKDALFELLALKQRRSRTVARRSATGGQRS